MPSGGPSDKDFSDLEEDFDPIHDEEEMEDEEENSLFLDEENGEEEEETSTEHSFHKKEAPLKKVALDKISLDCKIELGSINVSYETLANLSHESSIPVDLDPKQVFLTLNGQILHRGEIVEFDHQLFFKVLE